MQGRGARSHQVGRPWNKNSGMAMAVRSAGKKALEEGEGWDKINLVGNQNGVAFPPHRPSAIYLFLFFLDSSSSATRIRSSSS